MMKKKSSKYNARPLCTSDIVSIPLKEQYPIHAATRVATTYSFTNEPPKRTKTYNQPSLNHSKSQSSINQNKVALSLSSSSSTSSVSTVIATPSHSTPSIKQNKKRPLSSEIILRIMDQRLLQHQYQKQLEATTSATQLKRSSSLCLGLRQPRANKMTSKPIARRASTRQLQEAILKKPSKHALPRLYSQQQAALITEWPYVLTEDNTEQDRMVSQHYLLRTAFGSDFCAPTRPQLEKGIIVLDIGCGSGTWTMEMSTAFPKSTFIGIDKNACFPKDIKPRNCHFRTCDTLHPQQLFLPFPDNSIDYIFQRDLNWGLNAQMWQPLLQECLRILKPGGWIEFVESDLETQSSSEKECHLNDKLISGLCMRQQDPYAVHRLPTMLSINGFRQVDTITQSFPLGWGMSHAGASDRSETSTLADGASTVEQKEEGSKCSEFARAMSSQYLDLLKSLRPWLSLVMNLSHEKYDNYIAGLPAEWSRAKTFVNWHCIIAQKPNYT
ncbi:S-adenosyl-L-methionine-dependent methyltransferase [Rhizopus microsporus]|uniref:S-adenosyl-L-methionine-dependent methyltransferase n=2 Tax=Rhizopus TaxID=4842 RepID=A0A1X0RNA0_RHIZD|nr:S-adenosyl-L-methionine-dependent methyltransferase [Rhizopus microsporus]